MAGLLGWLGLAVSGASAHAQASSTNHAALWHAYADHFINSEGRVVDPQGGNRTTSEGQSYGLFFSLVNNDRATFDKLFAWTQTNLAGGDLGTHLPAWLWGKGKDGRWGILDPNSASDSDLWIAYDLIEAGRLWNDLNYATLGRRMAVMIGHREVESLPGLGLVLLPGAIGFRFQDIWVLNPSYTPIFLLDRMAGVNPAGPWTSVAAGIPSILQRSQKSGFAMDWICYTPGEGFDPCQANGKKSPPPMGSYDAIRVYLWTGMLSDTNPSKARILKSLSGMNLFMQTHAAPPEKIDEVGTPLRQGANSDGPVGFSAALLPYLESSGNSDAVAQQLVRIKSQLDEKSNLYGPQSGSGPTYYDQNLILFGSGWIEKRFQFGASGELLVRWSR